MEALAIIEQVGNEIQSKTNGQPLSKEIEKFVKATSDALSLGLTVDEMKKIRDKIDSIETYAKRRRAELASCNLLTAQRLRTEREIGLMLDADPNIKTGRPKLMVARPNHLSDYGISKWQSMRWQRIAKVDDDIFEEWIKEENENEKELSTTGLLRVWKSIFGTRHKDLLEEIAKDKIKKIRRGDLIDQLEALTWVFRYAESFFELMGCGETRTCLLRKTLDPDYIDDGWMKQVAERINPLSDIELDEKICEMCEKLANSSLDILEEVFLYD